MDKTSKTLNRSGDPFGGNFAKHLRQSATVLTAADFSAMGRVIRAQRKGAGGIFKVCSLLMGRLTCLCVPAPSHVLPPAPCFRSIVCPVPQHPPQGGGQAPGSGPL